MKEISRKKEKMDNSYQSLLNDFAFKYVFGKESKEANEALRVLLEVYLDLKIRRVKIIYPEMSKNVEEMKNTCFELLVDLENFKQMKIEIHVVDQITERTSYFTYRAAHLYYNQDMEDKLFSEATRVILFVISHEKYFEDSCLYQEAALYTEEGIFIGDAWKIAIVELPKLDESKSIEEMDQKEKMTYYLIHFKESQNNPKVKELLKEESIRIVNQRVKQIEEEKWKKLKDEYAYYVENEQELRF